VTRERTRYFEGQRLSATDLAEEQLYFRDKARRHNQALHGWGVVSGLRVERGPGRWRVRVSPGYAIDAYGEEIVIESEVVVDLGKEEHDSNVVRPCEPADGVSLDVVERLPGQDLYVAVRYAECYSRPVPVSGDGGLDEGSEYSRIRETFSISALTSPAAPWVTLAQVTLGSHLAVAKIESVTDRRTIPSPTHA
jgi:hypothetical protein